jgi:hypothetical protein
MSFTGKCTFTSGANLPELADDLADIVSIVAPAETPLLDALGDPARVATSTHHEWFEDALLPNTDNLAMPGLNDTAMTTTLLTVAHAPRFRPGDLVNPKSSRETLLVTAVNVGANQLTVARGYGASTKSALTDGLELRIISNAALEGQDAADARFSVRTRAGNYTQIFSATLQVSGSEAASRQLAVENELDYQKTCRLRELLRDLENTVLNGVANDTAPQGSPSVRRSMRGILASLTSHVFIPGQNGFPDDGGLTESTLNTALRTIWEATGSRIDTLVVGGQQKRKINAFLAESPRILPDSSVVRNAVSAYESDFGVCRIVLSRHMPSDAVLLLDSARLSVLPLAGRSFHYLPLAVTGDYTAGELLGEYTLELRNEAAHGLIRNLVTA